MDWRAHPRRPAPASCRRAVVEANTDSESHRHRRFKRMGEHDFSLAVKNGSGHFETNERAGRQRIVNEQPRTVLTRLLEKSADPLRSRAVSANVHVSRQLHRATPAVARIVHDLRSARE